MPIQFNSPTWSYICPEDGYLGDLVVQMLSLVPANSSSRSIIYGFTDVKIYQAFIEAQKRGVDNQLCCDESQHTTPIEQLNMEAFFQQFNRWNADKSPNVVFGTSWEHQIIHAKTIWVNWNESSTVEPTFPTLSTWQEYVTEGYPVVLRGSYNWSSPASKQINTIDISPSIELAKMYQDTYNRLRAFNLPRNQLTPTFIAPIAFVDDSNQLT